MSGFVGNTKIYQQFQSLLTVRWHITLFILMAGQAPLIFDISLRCMLHHILSLIAYTFRENQNFVFIIIMQFMMSANSRVRFGLQIVFVCLCIAPSHYHHCAKITDDCSAYSDTFYLQFCIDDLMTHSRQFLLIITLW